MKHLTHLLGKWWIQGAEKDTHFWTRPLSGSVLLDNGELPEKTKQKNWAVLPSLCLQLQLIHPKLSPRPSLTLHFLPIKPLKKLSSLASKTKDKQHFPPSLALSFLDSACLTLVLHASIFLPHWNCFPSPLPNFSFLNLPSFLGWLPLSNVLCGHLTIFPQTLGNLIS